MYNLKIPLQRKTSLQKFYQEIRDCTPILHNLCWKVEEEGTHSNLFYEASIVFQSLSWVWLFVTAWAAACHTFLSFAISQNLLKFMSIESVMLSNHLILCHPLLFLPSISPSIGVFPMKWLLASGGQSMETWASVFPVNIQD